MSDAPFKYGDKLRCIDAEGLSNLQDGKIYTAQWPRDVWVELQEFPFRDFDVKRFELVGGPQGDSHG